MNALVLGGFLGSGKSTLLLRFALRARALGMSIVVVENEIGAVDVDGEALRSSGGFKVVSMLAGCVCCTLLGLLPEAVVEIENNMHPDLLIIETTGIAVPRAVRDAIAPVVDGDVKVCVLADASRWRRMLVSMETVLRQQLKGAHFVLASKADLVSEEEMLFLEDSVRSLGCSAPLFRVSPDLPLPCELEEFLVVESGALPTCGGETSGEKAAILEDARDEGGIEEASIKVIGALGSAYIVHCNHHGTMVASVEVILEQGKFLESSDVLRMMKGLAEDVVEFGGVVGHIKAFARNSFGTTQISVVEPFVDPVSDDKGIVLGFEDEFRFVAAVANVSSESFGAAVIARLQCLLERRL